MTPNRAWESAAETASARARVAARRALTRLLAGRPPLSQGWETPEGAALLLDVAGEHGLLGAVLGELERRGISLPEPPAREARGRVAEVRLWQRHVRATTLRFVAALREAGVEAIVLKGPFLAERIYGDAGARSSLDVDLLVREASLGAAESVARALGFRPGPNIAGHWHTTWLQAGFPSVELHAALSGHPGTGLAGEGPLTRSVLHPTPDGEAVPILAAEDELLYLGVHACRHRFVRLAWEADPYFFLRRHPRLDWGLVRRRGRENGVELAVATALRRLQRDWGWVPPPEARPALGRRIRSSCALLWLHPGVAESRVFRRYRGAHGVISSLILEEGRTGWARHWIGFVAARLWSRTTRRDHRSPGNKSKPPQGP